MAVGPSHLRDPRRLTPVRELSTEEVQVIIYVLSKQPLELKKLALMVSRFMGHMAICWRSSYPKPSTSVWINMVGM